MMDNFKKELSVSASSLNEFGGLFNTGRNRLNFLVCTAFEDFEIERKILQTIIYPKLKNECFKEFGVDINIIDVSLGIDAIEELTDGYINNFLEFVEKTGFCDGYNCPLIMIGQKFGHPIVPLHIPTKVYDVLKRTMKKHRNMFLMHHSSLDVYYKLDSDDANKQMILIPADELFPQIRNGSAEEIVKYRTEWRNIRTMLRLTFHRLHKLCLQDDSLEPELMKKLFIYELDYAVSNILQRSLETAESPIIYMRDIVDLKNFINISNNESEQWRKDVLCRFIDILPSGADGQIQLDIHSQTQLSNLKVPLVEVFAAEVSKLKVLWRDPNGIDVNKNFKYLNKFISLVGRKIRDAVIQRQHYYITSNITPEVLTSFDVVANSYYLPVRFHSLYWGFEEIISTILSFVTDQTVNYPLLLYGSQNSGKDIIIAKTSYEVLSDPTAYCNYHTIIRNGSKSTSIKTVFASILHQIISIVFSVEQFETLINKAKNINPCSFLELVDIITNLPNITNYNFLIILHNLEECYDETNPDNINYAIPISTPENIKLILTTSENWENRNNAFFNLLVPEYTLTEYDKLVQAQSHSSYVKLESQLHSESYNVLLNTVDDILTAKILTEILKQISDINVPQEFTKFDLVNLLLNTIISRYNYSIVIHMISFIYYSRSGLTDTELIELLTLDEDVMSQLSKTNSNAIIVHDGNIKLSFGLYYSIKKDLSVFLTEITVDGHITVNLVSKLLFKEIIESNKNYESNYYHKLISEFYLNIWLNKNKMYKMANDKECYYCPILIQQNMVENGGDKTFYNYRKFRELVFHLVNSGMKNELLTEVIFNFDWLFNKIKIFGLNELLEDFMLSRNSGKEIMLLEESLQNSAAVITKDLNSLAAELIGQLLPYVPYYPNLKYLIENCDMIAPKHNAFIPIYPSEKLPGSALSSTIGCPYSIDSATILSNRSNDSLELLFKFRDDSNVYFYDLNQGQVSSVLLLSHGTICESQNNDVIVVLETKFKQVIKVHERETGKLLGQVIPMNWIVSRLFEERHKYYIHNVDVGKTKIALLITNEVSYLFLVDLKTFTMTLVFSPGIKLKMVKLSSDEKIIFTHKGERLISLNVETSELISAVELQGVPIGMKFFNKTEKKAFIICDKQKGIVVVELKEKLFFDRCYKISFSNCLEPDDFILDASHSKIGNPFLLIRSKHSVLLYDWRAEKVLCHVNRPSKLPAYFKLPNQHENKPSSLQFNAAELILEDRAIASALFRDIIICRVGDNRILTTLHAPVGGIVANLLVTDQYLIGQVNMTEDKAEIMIWRTDTNSLFSRLETSQDKLTKKVVQVSAGPTVAIASAENSDEMGVFNVANGTLVDLYSHAAEVINCVLSSCGKWAMVTVSSENNANILWSLESRKIVMEFGSKRTTDFVIAMHSNSGFIVGSNYSNSIDKPCYLLSQIDCTDQLRDLTMLEENLEFLKQLTIENLGFIEGEPICLQNDRLLIMLCRYFNTGEVPVDNLAILIWRRCENYNSEGKSKCVTGLELGDQIDCALNISAIFRNHKDNDSIFVLFNTSNNSYGFLLFGCDDGLVTQYILFNTLEISLNFRKLHVSNFGLFGYDEDNGLVLDLNVGSVIGSVRSDEVMREHDHGSEAIWKFRCFALQDTALVVSLDTSIVAWKLVPKFTCIGRSEMRSVVTCGCLCKSGEAGESATDHQSDCILMVGCADGAVMAVALVVPGETATGVKRNFPPPLSTSPTDIQLPALMPRSVQNPDELNGDMMQDDDLNSTNFITLPKRPFSDTVLISRREMSDI